MQSTEEAGGAWVRRWRALRGCTAGGHRMAMQQCAAGEISSYGGAQLESFHVAGRLVFEASCLHNRRRGSKGHPAFATDDTTYPAKK
eukprot:365952-Chlamydomonas_euryale.AAC.7